MESLKALAQAASELRVALSLVLKSELGREVLRNTAPVSGLVLQDGGAVHHVFGSPRYSADLDFAQQPDLDEERLGTALQAAAVEARQAWGACTLEAAASKGRLHRQKLRVPLDAGTSHVLAIERCQVAVHQPETRPVLGGGGAVRVESAAEIVADKLVAAIDRFAVRGMMKLRDVFDIAFLLELGRPPRDLLLAKLADLLDEVAAERLRGELRDVLPQPHLDRFDPRRAIRQVTALCQELCE